MSEEEIKKPLTKEELSLIRELVYAEKVFDMSFQNIAKKLLNEVDLKETQLQQKENIIKELKDKIEDDKMIIEGNWGCIENLKKDYILHKNIIKEIKEYNEKIIEEGWYGGFEKENAKHNLEILDKE